MNLSRMPLVPSGIEFALRTRSSRMYRRYILERACSTFCTFRTDMDVRDTKQQRCFCFAKTRRQQMYTDAHLLTRHLLHLFVKALVKGSASTASLRKSECSTYSKYVSASLLLNSLYLHRLFSKALVKGSSSTALQSE